MNEAEFFVHHDPRKNLRLECDESPDVLGVKLLHRINRRVFPIAFLSRSLTLAERNYLQLKKEALAVVFGVSISRLSLRQPLLACNKLQATNGVVSSGAVNSPNSGGQNP